MALGLLVVMRYGATGAAPRPLLVRAPALRDTGIEPNGLLGGESVATSSHLVFGLLSLLQMRHKP
jgi:hypothetical protein